MQYWNSKFSHTIPGWKSHKNLLFVLHIHVIYCTVKCSVMQTNKHETTLQLLVALVVSCCFTSCCLTSCSMESHCTLFTVTQEVVMDTPWGIVYTDNETVFHYVLIVIVLRSEVGVKDGSGVLQCTSHPCNTLDTWSWLEFLLVNKCHWHLVKVTRESSLVPISTNHLLKWCVKKMCSACMT